MKSCPKCAKKFDDSWSICLTCNVQLVDVSARLSQLEAKAEQILAEIQDIRQGVTVKKETFFETERESVARQPQSALEREPVVAENAETQIGKYWLNKIGVISLVAGIAFFIAYTFQYLSAVYKIVASYVISSVLLLWGMKVEQNIKFKRYGTSLIAGGWALIYFVTFAMYHVAAVRVIHSQIADLILLAIVVAVMIAHLLKYRSQNVVAMVLFLGYFTAGISQVSSFTLIYITLLTVTAAVLSYKMRWYELPIFSMAATYCTYFIWTRPQMRFSDAAGALVSEKFWLCFGFITLYWITYSVLSFIIKAEGERQENTVVNSVFLNAACFGLLGGLACYNYNPGMRFGFLLISGLFVSGVSLAAKLIPGKRYLFYPYMLSGILFASMSLWFKLDREWVNILWLLEIPLLTFLGLTWKSRMYRLAAGVLVLIMSFRMLFLLAIRKALMTIFGWEMSVFTVTLCIGIACFYLTKLFYRFKQKAAAGDNEKFLANFYVFSGTFFLMLLIYMEAAKRFISLTWAAGAFALFGIGFLCRERYFRYAALLVVAVTLMRIVFIDLASLDIIYRILAFVGLGIILLAVSYFYTRSNTADKE